MPGTEKMNPDQFKEFLKQREAAEEQGSRNKYRNIPVEIDGIKFQSTKEGNYYGQCKLMFRAKVIERFERQVTFNLEVNGVHITDYRADFVLYYPGGKVEVIDVKSKGTAKIPLYLIKKQLMFAILNIKIIEK